MKSVNEFDVGTIVYFISSKNEKVIPALVAEKIVRTSLANSSKVTYILEIRTGKSIKSVEVDPINVDLFSNPQEIRAFMITRTTKAIDDLIAVAVEAASTFNVTKHTQEEHVPSPTFSDGEDIAVVLEDGKVAKLRM
jgi:hypothetical protein